MSTFHTLSPEFGKIITKRKVITKRRIDLVKFGKIITKRKVITRRRVELLPVGGSPKKPEIGFQERQTVPPAEGVQTPSMTRRGPQPSPSSSSELILPVSPATRGNGFLSYLSF
ncbi:hypothetical protein TNCT_173942 [Trichonephila clavata]|uniref:Uncharacterized protein n=1 Tax=Trichonephila clavata TaxID=2740835 RepID=A0A8X6GFY3_TRICU|nr:hypothetical protein TNCT_173942 [Trichonephila clavata]